MLTQIRLKGFRAFADDTTLDFAGDAVILVGPNGTGKTSVFDGIEWAFFGMIPRLRGSRDAVGEDYIRNRFSPNVSPEVTVHVSNHASSAVVRRTSDALSVVDASGTQIAGRRAASWVSALVGGPDADSAAAAIDTFDRTFLLGQEKIVDFIRDTNPRDRFDSLSTLLGADVVRRFYRRADAWAGSAGAQLAEADAAILRSNRSIEQMRLRRVALEAQAAAGSETTVDRIQTELKSLEGRGKRAGLRWPTPAKLGRLNAIVSSLNDLVAQSERQRSRIQMASTGSAELLAEATPTAELRERLVELEQQREPVEIQRIGLQRDYDGIAQSIAEGRDRLSGLEGELGKIQMDRRDLAEFLTMARSFVHDDTCPVCEQPIDHLQVIRRLEARARALPEAERRVSEERAQLTAKMREFQAALDQVNGQMQRVRATEARRASEERSAARQIENWEARVRELTSDWGVLQLDGVEPALKSHEALLRPMAVRLQGLLAEAIAVQARLSLGPLAESEADAKREVERLALRRRALLGVTDALEQLARDAKSSELSIVRDAIERQMPTLRAVYQRLRPHPLFDALDVRFGTFGDRGEVYYRASHAGTSGNVSMIFSSAQLNAVAVCIFVTLNLMRAQETLNLLLLDDPIQNMDDYNVLGLVDLLRSLRGAKQVVVSTHDEQIGQLFRRKLRPRDASQRTITHRFLSTDEHGPRIMTTVDEFSRQPLLLDKVAG